MKPTKPTPASTLGEHLTMASTSELRLPSPIQAIRFAAVGLLAVAWLARR
jgi:hypothetical protein